MARRALVVDDSRSARAFLTRILERYELTVDAVESAEQAIEYLAQQRPDVIFMDHLMPGMDGFQAVQAIKNNPRTATIPIMMYTSQEGELYLSQARALGAIGVLPKQIKPADVSKALEQLRLRPEHRVETETVPAMAVNDDTVFASGTRPALSSAGVVEQRMAERAVAERSTTERSAAERTAAAAAYVREGLRDSPHEMHPREGSGGGGSERPASDSGARTHERRSPDRPDAPNLPPELRTVLEAMLAHHGRELRRFVVDNLESQADRILGDMKLLLQDTVPEPVAEPAESFGTRAAPWLAAAGFLVAVVFGVLWWQRTVQSSALSMQLARSQQQLADTQRSLQMLQSASRTASPQADPHGAEDASAAAPSTSMVEPVPFGEMPLGGARLEAVSQLLTRLNAQGFRGVVQIRSIPGRYCMMDGPGGQPVLPAAATPYAKCDQVGNPHEDDDSASERQSIAFANMISTARASSKFQIEVSAGNADEVAIPYPAVTDTLTAGEWNRAAAANNRVELHWQAASP
jgi:CheY-like chemotaxis protein